MARASILRRLDIRTIKNTAGTAQTGTFFHVSHVCLDDRRAALWIETPTVSVDGGLSVQPDPVTSFPTSLISTSPFSTTEVSGDGEMTPRYRSTRRTRWAGGANALSATPPLPPAVHILRYNERILKLFRRRGEHMETSRFA